MLTLTDMVHRKIFFFFSILCLSTQVVALELKETTSAMQQVSIRDFGAVPDDGVDDTAAIQAAAASASVIHVPNGVYDIAAPLMLNAFVIFDGGLLRVSNAPVLLKLGYAADPYKCFEEVGNGTVSVGLAQDVRPEHWGSSAENVNTALKRSYSGSRILLQGRVYVVNPIEFSVSPELEGGGDSGKIIEGVLPAQRYRKKPVPYVFFGTVLQAAKSMTDVVSFNSSSAFSFGSVGLKNLMVDGNYLASNGVNVYSIKDVLLENLYIHSAKQDGLVFTSSNNQVQINGFLETYNNGRDGVWGGGIGDVQWSGTVRCVNNARYGFYAAGGYIEAASIYAYFNGDAGIRWDNTAESHVGYMRSEDNGRQGLRYAGSNLTIDYLSTPDNGVTGFSIVDRVGVYNSGANLDVGHLDNPIRSAATHNQIRLWYDHRLARGGSVGYINNQAYLAHAQDKEGVERGIQTELQVRNSLGTKFNKLRTFIGTCSSMGRALADADIYSAVRLTACNVSFVLPKTTVENSPHSMERTFEFVASAGINVAFDKSYVSAAGVHLPNMPMSAGQTLNLQFIRVGSKWVHQLTLVSDSAE